MIRVKQIDFEKLDQLIRKKIPSGMNVRSRKHENADQTDVFGLRCIGKVNHIEKELKAIGTLGGGNHFIEVDKDDEDHLYIVIHSGSRHLGKEVAEIYQDLAYRQCNGITKEEISIFTYFSIINEYILRKSYFLFNIIIFIIIII